MTISSEGGDVVGEEEGDFDRGGGEVLDMGPRTRMVTGGGPRSLRRAIVRRYKSKWSSSTTRNSNSTMNLTSGRYPSPLCCFALDPRNQHFRFQSCWS